MKITKNRKEIIEKFDFTASHDILSASKIVKESSKEKFDASIDIAVRLGVEPGSLATEDLLHCEMTKKGCGVWMD